MQIKTLGTIAYMIVMVFYGVYTMILSIQAYSKFSDTSDRYLNIANNYKQSPIIDVVDKKGLACDSGYSSIFNWDWKGFSAGCDCSAAKSGQLIMYANACTANYTTRGCKTTPSITAQPFNYFEGATNQKMNICVKRMDSTNAFYKVASKQSGTCSLTQKMCGNPSVKETVYCVNIGDPCPIYDIVMSPTNNDPRYSLLVYTKRTLDNGQYLYVDQLGLNAQNPPLSELRLTQGSGVCDISNSAKRLPSGQSDYVLSLTNRTSCSGIDTHFIWNQFQIAENKYYQLNLNPSDYTRLSALPGIKIPSSIDPFKTYYRSFIRWAVSQRDKLKAFVDSADELINLKGAQLTVMVINIFVCIMVSIVLQVSQVYNLMGKDVPCIDGKGDEEQVRITKIKKILSYGGKLLQTPFLLWAFIVSAQKKGILRGVADSAPMDSDYNSQINAFANQIENDVYKKNLTALIILLITILLDIVLYIKGKYWPSKKNDTVQPAKMDEENNLKPVNQSNFQNNQYDPSFTPQNPQTMQMQPIQQGTQPGMQQGLVYQQQPGMMPMQQGMQPGVVYQQQQQQQQPSVVYQQQPGVVYQQQPGVVYQQQPGVVYQQQGVYQQQQPVFVQPIQPVVLVAQPMY